MAVKEKIKLELIHRVKSFNEAIIIAGLGRCGTTLLHNSIVQNHYYKGHKQIIKFSNDIINYNNGIIYKTHDYPPSNLLNNVKVIFMFGNPMNTAISTHRRINEWGKSHHYHLGSEKFVENDDILSNDSLNLYNLFKAWIKSQNFEFLSLRYESLYNEPSLELLREYLGFNVKLLPYIPRKTDWNTHRERKSLELTYGDLENLIMDTCDAKIWKKKS